MLPQIDITLGVELTSASSPDHRSLDAMLGVHEAPPQHPVGLTLPLSQDRPAAVPKHGSTPMTPVWIEHVHRSRTNRCACCDLERVKFRHVLFPSDQPAVGLDSFDNDRA
jgi:hypothetical protein